MRCTCSVVDVIPSCYREIQPAEVFALACRCLLRTSGHLVACADVGGLPHADRPSLAPHAEMLRCCRASSLLLLDASRGTVWSTNVGASSPGAAVDFFTQPTACRAVAAVEPRWVPSPSQTILVADTVATGEIVGTVGAADADVPGTPASTLTFRLLSAVPSTFSTFFTFGTSTGHLSTARSIAGLASNPNTNRFTLTLSVSDGLGVAAATNATVTVLVRPAYSQTVLTCPPGWTQPAGSDSCYRAAISSTGSWYTASTTLCPTLPNAGALANLASIRNEAEANFVIRDRCGAPNWLSERQYWIGLSEERSPSTSQGIAASNIAGRRGCCYSWANNADPAWMRNATGGQLWWFDNHPDGNTGWHCGLVEPLVSWQVPNRLRNWNCGTTGFFACCEAPRVSADSDCRCSRLQLGMIGRIARGRCDYGAGH